MQQLHGVLLHYLSQSNTMSWMYKAVTGFFASYFFTMVIVATFGEFINHDKQVLQEWLLILVITQCLILFQHLLSRKKDQQ